MMKNFRAITGSKKHAKLPGIAMLFAEVKTAVMDVSSHVVSTALIVNHVRNTADSRRGIQVIAQTGGSVA